MSITFVTGNKNKLREVQAILDGIVAVENVDIDITEIQGTKEAIVMDKCDKAAQEVHTVFSRPCYVEVAAMIRRMLTPM